MIVWEHRRSFLDLVSRVVAECGARPRWTQSFSAIEEIEFSGSCPIAVVGLGARPCPGDLGLEVIRTLKHKGFKVICYEEGAQSWPLGIRCQALLAGCASLLDSAQEGFHHELSRSLRQFLRAEAVRREEVDRIKGLMKELGIVGESRAMISVFQWVLRVAKLSDLPTLIEGETGTG